MVHETMFTCNMNGISWLKLPVEFRKAFRKILITKPDNCFGIHYRINSWKGYINH
ncbi:MAG: hypothetical protein Q8S18_02705 [Bacteroidales bacterium]|nr:hypothetical protein [Bacteroidales bacterium]